MLSRRRSLPIQGSVSLTVSPRVRVIALAGLLAALALAIGLYVLGRTSQPSSSATPKPVTPLRAAVQAAVVPSIPHLPARPVGKPAVRPARPAPRPAVAANGLPPAIASALAEHEVVVVALYAPRAAVDAIALSEAGAGASLAGAGFVALNVTQDAKAGPLTSKLGVLTDPAVLVFKRPAELFLRIDGFADRETVAQAAANAAS